MHYVGQGQGHFVGTVDLHIGLPDAFNLWHQHFVTLGPSAAFERITLQSSSPPVTRRGDLQNFADRLDPKGASVRVNETRQDLSRRSSSAWAKNALASFSISLARRSSLTSRSSSLTR